MTCINTNREMAKPNLDPMASDFLLVRSHDLQKKKKGKGKEN